MTEFSETNPPTASLPQTTWQKTAYRLEQVPFWHTAVFLLVFLTIAEALTTLFEPRVGLILHGMLLLFVFFLALIFHNDNNKSGFLYAFAVAPLIRLMSLSLPLPTFPFIYWYAVVGLPLMLAGYFAMRTARLQPRDVGLNLKKPLLQGLIALTGIGLGAIEYMILRPEPLISHFSWPEFILAALILLIFTGFLEEFIFRGVMQHTAVVNFGWQGLIYVSLVFAVLHIGYRSLIDVFFVFIVAVFFALMAQLTGSISGVSIAHALTNIGLFLVFPFILGGQVSNQAIISPRPSSAFIASVTGRATQASTGQIVTLAGMFHSEPTETTLVHQKFTPSPTSPGFQLSPSPTIIRPIVTGQPPTESPAHPSPTETNLASPSPTPVLSAPILMEMVSFSTGIFRMGCDEENRREACHPDEIPLHSVSLNAFSIDRFEVSNAQYAACVAAGACNPPASFRSLTRSDYYSNPAYSNYPVIHINWDDADAYCRWEDKRLPTEAEWERAARKGKLSWIFPWGNQAAGCSTANFSSGDGLCGMDTSKVGAYPDGASTGGVMDLSGNVAEWVADWYQGNYYYNSPAADPAGPSDRQYKVLRGGSFSDDWQGIRAAARGQAPPNFVSPLVGFRCATSP